MHGILGTPASKVHERLKTNGTVIKILRETTEINKRNIIRGETFTETTIFIHEDKY